MGKPATARRLEDNEAMAFVRVVRTSPQKVNLVAQMIRGMKASEALAQLTFSKKAVAVDVKKALQSAIANAENNHMLDVDKLYVAEAYVGKSFSMKRFMARGRGRASRITKQYSNLKVIVRETEKSGDNE